MAGQIKVKICGLSTPRTVHAAVDAGAAYLGFVFFPKSPRNVSVSQAAELTALVPPGIARVALTVNADDATLDAITQGAGIDMLQLHGAETPDRVAAVKARYGLPVMKAVGLAHRDDIAEIDTYSQVADQLLVDAKPPPGGAIPGGNGLTFDWRLLAGRRWSLPWMLAGGLTPANVGEATALTGAMQVDVSSGVESAPGVKDARLISSFLAAAG